MRKIRLLIPAFLFAGIINAQSSTAEQLAVQQKIENMFAALTNGDITALKTLVTDKVRFYEYGQVWNLDTIVQKVMLSNSTKDFKRTNSFEFVNTTILQNTAWVTYYLESGITRNSKSETVNWMETVVMIRERNQWKIDVLHSTRISKN